MSQKVTRCVGPLVLAGDRFYIDFGKEEGHQCLNAMLNSSFLANICRDAVGKKVELMYLVRNLENASPVDLIFRLRVVPDDTPICVCEHVEIE